MLILIAVLLIKGSTYESQTSTQTQFARQQTHQTKQRRFSPISRAGLVESKMGFANVVGVKQISCVMRVSTEIINTIQMAKFEFCGTARPVIRCTVRTNPRHSQQIFCRVVGDKSHTHLVLRTFAKFTSIFVVTGGSNESPGNTW